MMAFMAPAFAGLSTAMSSISGIVSTVGAVAGGMYKAKVASNNAKVATNNANAAVARAAVEAQEGDMEASADLGQLMAAASASGLVADSGSKALVRKSATELAAKDRGYRIYAGATEAAGYKQQAEDFRAEAKGARFGAIMDGIGGAMDFGSNLISDASPVNPDKARGLLRPRSNPRYFA
jgi:hypothetical protein